jgi:hypothetical protein
MRSVHQLQAQLTSAPPPHPAGGPALEASALARWQELAGRLHERLLGASLAFLDNYPAPFAQYVQVGASLAWCCCMPCCRECAGAGLLPAAAVAVLLLRCLSVTVG